MNETEVTRPPSRHPRRVVALGAVAVVVLVAATVAVATGRSGSGGQGARPRLPSPSATAVGATAAAGPATTASGPAERSAGPAVYVWQGKVTTLPASAPGYRLDARAGTAAVSALAVALGLHGSVQAGPSDYWTVLDGVARLEVSQTGGGWSYTAATTSSCIGIAAVQGAKGGIVCSGAANGSTGPASSTGAAGSTGSGSSSGAAGGAAIASPPPSPSSPSSPSSPAGSTAASPPSEATATSPPGPGAVPTTTPSSGSGVASFAPSPGSVPATTLLPVAGCPRPPCPAGMMCPDICGATPPVADLPSAEQAGQDVRTVLTRAGIDVTGADLTTSATPWSVSVTVNPRIAGLPTLGVASAFTLGAKGVIRNATGWLVAPTKLANYPLIGSQAGFARLQAHRDVLWGSMLYGAVPVAAQPGPAPQIVVTGPRLGLVTVRGQQGSYLEPAYLFDQVPPGTLSPAVAAVAEGDLQAVDPGGPVQPAKPPVTARTTLLPGGASSTAVPPTATGSTS